MAFTETTLGQSQIADTTTTVYTAAAASVLKHMSITNTTGAAATITVYVDPDGTTADDTTAIIKGFEIPANLFITWDGFIPIAVTGTIKAVGGTDDAITITAGGATL